MTAKNHTYPPVTHCFTIISQNKEQSPIVLSVSRKGIHATWFRLSRTFLQPTPHNISLAQKNDTLNPFRKVHLENHFMQTSYKLSRAKTKTMKNYSSCHVIDGSFATQQREDKRISLFCSILLFFWNTWPERKLAHYDVLKNWIMNWRVIIWGSSGLLCLIRRKIWILLTYTLVKLCS